MQQTEHFSSAIVCDGGIIGVTKYEMIYITTVITKMIVSVHSMYYTLLFLGISSDAFQWQLVT